MLIQRQITQLAFRPIKIRCLQFLYFILRKSSQASKNCIKPINLSSVSLGYLDGFADKSRDQHGFLSLTFALSVSTHGAGVLVWAGRLEALTVRFSAGDLPAGLAPCTPVSHQFAHSALLVLRKWTVTPHPEKLVGLYREVFEALCGHQSVKVLKLVADCCINGCVGGKFRK